VSPVTGVGGVFVRARDPETLAAWYSAALGITFADGFTAVLPAGAPDDYTVFALFPPDSTYIGDPAYQGVMVNLRVRDIDAVVAQITAAGGAAEPVADEEYGRFTWTTDPEGNRIELWEPSSASSPSPE
jgi:predicted enzyme related to lactoylglutathione lyase